ncbi:MAG: flavodoxin family protein [Acidobacteria bacterium]|nr:flavodoxin family protein [Acidobacteriota bacterium]
MNIVAILGSPHGMKGTTGALLAGVISSAEAAGAEVKTFLLSKITVKPCLACDVCHRTGECSIKDDFKTIKAAMIAADGIILASPNYITSVSAQMKAVFDRCCGPLHCQAMQGKYGATVVTSGGAESKVVEKYMIGFLQIMGCWTVGSVGAEAQQIMDEKARAPKLKAAARLGTRLAKAIREKKTYPGQVAVQRSFYERMKSLVTMRKDDWNYEYKYWKSLGRL